MKMRTRGSPTTNSPNRRARDDKSGPGRPAEGDEARIQRLSEQQCLISHDAAKLSRAEGRGIGLDAAWLARDVVER
jgi:hypothetical protein